VNRVQWRELKQDKAVAAFQFRKGLAHFTPFVKRCIQSTLDIKDFG